MTGYVPPPPPPRRRSYVMRFLGFVFATGVILFLVGAAAAGIVLWSVTKELPDYEVLEKYEPPVMTRIHANDGALIAEFARERRIFVPLSTIPKPLIQAFLSAEDKNFYEHRGIDFQGVARAIYLNFTTGSKQGASTITQQVAKNFLLTNERTYDRKLKEAILAIRIERAFTKDQILELYMNEIFLGLSSYGVAAAALNYFGKELHELTIGEVAYLAALPKAPNNYHPFRHREAAVERRNWVIDQMATNKYITPEEAKAAKAEALTVNPRPFGAHIFAAEFFAEDVRRELIARYSEEKLYGGGLSVRTTLDPTLQRYAKKALVDGLARFDRERGWRGPRTKIELGADWGETLGKMDYWEDIEPWRLGVVIDIDDSRAIVGLQPKKDADGSILKDRRLRRAAGFRRQMGDGQEEAHRHSQRRRRHLRCAGCERSQGLRPDAGARGRRRHRRHGPAYGPRAGPRWRLLLCGRPVQSGDPGAPPARLLLQAFRLRDRPR